MKRHFPKLLALAAGAVVAMSVAGPADAARPGDRQGHARVEQSQPRPFHQARPDRDSHRYVWRQDRRDRGHRHYRHRFHPGPRHWHPRVFRWFHPRPHRHFHRW